MIEKEKNENTLFHPPEVLMEIPLGHPPPFALFWLSADGLTWLVEQSSISARTGETDVIIFFLYENMLAATMKKRVMVRQTKLLRL